MGKLRNARNRYGTGVNSYSFRTRCVVSAPFVIVEALLLYVLVRAAFDPDDARPAAFVLFVLTPATIVTVVVLRALWKPASEVVMRERAAAAEERRRVEGLAAKRPHVSINADDDSATDVDGPATAN